jgi:hypothetical protein
VINACSIDGANRLALYVSIWWCRMILTQTHVIMWHPSLRKLVRTSLIIIMTLMSIPKVRMHSAWSVWEREMRKGPVEIIDGFQIFDIPLLYVSLEVYILYEMCYKQEVKVNFKVIENYAAHESALCNNIFLQFFD